MATADQTDAEGNVADDVDSFLANNASPVESEESDVGSEDGAEEVVAPPPVFKVRTPTRKRLVQVSCCAICGKDLPSRHKLI